MKIIDLLNKIAKAEQTNNFNDLPKKIKYRDDNLEYEAEYKLLIDYEHGRNWIVYTEDDLTDDVWGELKIDSYNLNDEIEILDKGE